MTPPASAAMPVGCTRCCWSSLSRFPTARFWTWAAARESCCGRWGSGFRRPPGQGWICRPICWRWPGKSWAARWSWCRGTPSACPLPTGGLRCCCATTLSTTIPTRARRRRSLPGCSSPAACSCWETARPRRGCGGWPTCSSPCPARGTCASTAGRSWPPCWNPTSTAWSSGGWGAPACWSGGFGKTKSTGPPHMRRARAGYSSMAK